MLSHMDAQQALADLTEISSQIQAAAVFDDEGRVAASTLGDPDRANEFVRAASDLLAQAEGIAVDNWPLVQLEIATLEGSVFVVRDGKRRIVATTGPEPTVGLVFYDLKSALRQLSAKAERKTPARKTTTRKTSTKKTTAAAAKKKPATRPKKPDAS